MDTKNRDLLVKEWMRKASHDLGIADSLLQNNSPYTDGICFHCQQAVVKYLKAVLIAHSLEFKNSHDLAYLADILA